MEIPTEIMEEIKNYRPVNSDLFKKYGIPIRVKPYAGFLETIREYPVIEEFGEWKNPDFFILKSGPVNKLLGFEFAKPDDRISSTMINILLWFLIP